MTRRRAWIAASAAVLVLLGGCSTTTTGDGRPAPAVAASAPLGEVGADATDAVAQAVTDMVELPHGFAVSFGAGTSLAIDARYDGADGHATLTIGGHSCEIIGVQAKAWAKGGQAFWEATDKVDAGQAQAAAQRWVELTGPVASLARYVDAKAFLATLSAPGADPVFGPVSTVDGRKVQRIDVTPAVAVTVTLATPHVIVSIGGDAVSFTYPADDLSVAPPADPIPFPS